MDELHLGPNGGLVLFYSFACDNFELNQPETGLIYCMEYLEANIEWLKERLDKLAGKFILFDCPGQAELYTVFLGELARPVFAFTT